MGGCMAASGFGIRFGERDLALVVPHLAQRVAGDGARATQSSCHGYFRYPAGLGQCRPGLLHFGQ